MSHKTSVLFLVFEFTVRADSFLFYAVPVGLFPQQFRNPNPVVGPAFHERSRIVMIRLFYMLEEDR